jgi:hypothetical protein
LDDKRSHPRVPIDATLRCEPKTGAAFDAKGRDVSVGGMFL